MGVAESRWYRFEPLDDSGVLLGLGAVQCALLGTGLAAAVLLLTAGAPMPLAAIPLLVAAVVSFARAGGHPLWRWAPLGAGWLSLHLWRGARWHPQLPLVTVDGDVDAPLPPCLAGLSLTQVPWGARRTMGAVLDGERHTLTALVGVTGPRLVVQLPDEQHRLLEAWGSVLDQLAAARGAVVHLAWSDFAVPSTISQHRSWLASERRASGHLEAAASYDELLGAVAASAMDHDVVVTVTVARDRTTRRHRTGGGDPLAQVLASAVDALLRGAQGADLTVGRPLGLDDIRHLLRRRMDPCGTHPRAGRRGRLVDRLGLVTAGAVGPMAVETGWRHVRVDGTFHRTFHVASWPRRPVPPTWLEPFLAEGGLARTMAVVLRPVPGDRSRRQIERDLVKLESDAVTKEERGRRVDARHRRAAQAVLDREEDLVAGHAELAYAGLVTVHAATLEELDDHADAVEQLARETGLVLRCLEGRQDLAWAAALPLGLAPATLLAT